MNYKISILVEKSPQDERNMSSISKFMKDGTQSIVQFDMSTITNNLEETIIGVSKSLERVNDKTGGKSIVKEAEIHFGLDNQGKIGILSSAVSKNTRTSIKVKLSFHE